MQGCEPAGRPTTPGVRRAAPAWSRSPPPRRRRRSGATDDAPRARRSRYPVPSSTMRLKQRLTSEARAARAGVGGLRHRGGFRPQLLAPAREARDRRPRCRRGEAAAVRLPTYPSTRPLGGDAHEEGLFPDLEGTRNDHLPLWLITFREPPERPAERRPAPFEPGRSARRRRSESQSGRACAESPSRPSSPAKHGPSTRARCWFDDAAGDHNILRSTRVQNLSVSRARQHASPSARSCRFPRPFVSPRRPSLRASSANRHSCAWR